MEYDHPGIDDALSLALERFFHLDGALLDQGGRPETLVHRLGYYLENECRSRLLLADLVVEMSWNPPTMNQAGEHGVPLPLPSLALHTRTNPPQKILALECRRNLLGPADKRKLLALDNHADGFDRALGLAWKPGADYFLLYYIREDGVSLRRIKKAKPRIQGSRKLRS